MQASTAPEELEKLLRAALVELPHGGFSTVVGAALDLLEPNAFPGLVAEALDVLQNDRENRVAIEIVKATAFQFPFVLLPHLSVLNELLPGHYGRYEPYPRLGCTFWESILWQASGNRAYHLTFEPAYFANLHESLPFWTSHHPTWNLPTKDAPLMPFGGMYSAHCKRCNGILHHLLSFDPIPQGIGVTDLPRLTLAVCLSCVGWEAWCEEGMFYKHDNEGQPEHIPEVDYDDLIEPKFPAVPLQPTLVHLVETPSRWLLQAWRGSSNHQNIHHVGGYASWIQDKQYTDCPECGQTMRFLMQLDSDLPTVDGSTWEWGSGGIGYGVWCDHCKISGFFWQCT